MDRRIPWGPIGDLVPSGRRHSGVASDGVRSRAPDRRRAGPKQEVPVRRITSLAADEGGQTTAEYSLVLLVAGLVVGVFAAFVKGGALASMFREIVSGLLERAGG
jgi:hypothetical protein